MNLFLGMITILVAIKGLGGSFHAVITRLGLLEYHGPIVGALIGGLMLMFFFSYERPSLISYSAEKPSKKAWTIFFGLFFLLVFFALEKRVQGILHHPINVHQADMLSLVRAGLNSVLEGHSPYRPHLLEDGVERAAFYLPGLWLAYLPLHALGIDFRFTNVFAHLLFYLVLLDLFRRSRRFPISFPVAGAGFLALIGLHGFSKLAVAYVSAVHTGGFEIYLSLFVWGVSRGYWRLLVVVAPFLILSRELAILFMIPYALFLWRTDAKRFYVSVGGVVVLGALLTVPFILVSKANFFAAFQFYATHSQQTAWEVMMQYYGLCGFLKRAGLLWLQPVAQLSGLVVAIWFTFRKLSPDPFRALALGGITFVPFMLFVSVLWGYVFMEPLMMTYFLLLAPLLSDQAPLKTV